MITLLSVVGDSDVRAKDTEVGEGTPLTSPFIEGIYEFRPLASLEMTYLVRDRGRGRISVSVRGSVSDQRQRSGVAVTPA